MSWRTVNLGQLVDNFSVRAKDHPAETSDLEFFGVSNEYGITKSKYAAEDKAEDYKIIEKDCFAYNPYRINVGSIGLLEDDIVGLISPAYVVFKPKPRGIIPQLLLKFIKSAEGLRQIKMYARGTVRQALRFEDLCKIEISIPDYDEQIEFFKRISATETESNILSTELTNQLDLVKQLRQSFLREAMQGKLVPQDPNDEPASLLLEKIKAEKERLIKEKKIKKQKPLPPITEEEIPFEIPENWVWCRLGEITDFITKGTTPKKFNKVLGIPYLKVYNIVNQKINFEYKPQFVDKEIHDGLLNRSKVYPGDVIMNIVGPPLGKVAIIPDTYPEWNINQALAIFRPLVSEISNFIYWYLCFGIEIKSLRVLGVAGQDNLSLEQCRNVIFPLAPLSEQMRIVANLDELMKYCDELEASIKESQQQNEMLLQQVLREALEPKDIKDLSESI